MRDFVTRVCERQVTLGFADPQWLHELCYGDDTRYWQRLSEALVGYELREAGLDVRPSRDGPDFLVKDHGRNIWVEVICPEPTGIPKGWLEPELNRVITFPHEAILLRWTAAIKEKAEKLLGNPATGRQGYVAKGVVAPGDAYVIAINARLLRSGAFPSLEGISQLPFAVEAVFAVGPYQIHLDRQTLKAIGGQHQERWTIAKPNGAQVPATTFVDPAFAPVSAIWAMDYDVSAVIGNMKPMAVVHNPLATSPIAPELLPAAWEFVASVESGDAYRLERVAGRQSRA